MANHLVNESSPYLLQHANNPVDWYPWSDDALQKARQENKLILVSIGYSACHWCHVMEHESFEDNEVAGIMNNYFLCIKVDREERPDIDQLYMDAVHLMAGRGGWPLNCFALPDGRPIYGGTYFPKEQWLQILNSLAKVFKEEPAKVLEFAKELEEGIKKISLLPDFTENGESVDLPYIKALADKMKDGFDKVWGGHAGAPKFPMPTNYEFLLYYAYVLKHLKKEDEAKTVNDHIYLTLDKMAMGGMYDALEGGFARYSTDAFWKAPHFEKMLYDNAQLMSLYSNAYRHEAKKLYKEVVYGIYNFTTTSLLSPEGGFFSALDADSQGKEGEYYVWKKDELQFLLGNGFTLFAEYFSIHDNDVWEDGKFILYRKLADEAFCVKNNISPEQLELKKKNWIDLLKPYRRKRVAPGLDDKILASWNGLMLKGLVEAYETFVDISFLDTAIKTANFICDKLLNKDSSLWRNYKNGNASIQGFLEDYAFTADAFFHLYQCTFDEKWLVISEKLVEYAFKHFYNKQKNVFYFTADYHNSLITRKAEMSDNVIPASNSAMANLLFKLGHCLAKEDYIKTSAGMLSGVKENMGNYPYGYTNWAILALRLTCRFYEVAVVGNNAAKFRDDLNTYYCPNKIVLGAQSQSKLELLKNKFAPEKTLIYVCENKTCHAPVQSPDEAIYTIEEV